MPRSPISAPDIPDKSPIPIAAVATATDETLWALLRLLVERNVIDAEDLAANLQEVGTESQRTGSIRTQEDADRFATSLAIQRMVESLIEMR